MSKIIYDVHCGIIYTIDLLTAFNFLKPGTFSELYTYKMLFFCVLDFLTNSRFIVKVGEAKSNIKSFDRDCIQGSIYGPKTFTL